MPSLSRRNPQSGGVVDASSASSHILDKLFDDLRDAAPVLRALGGNAEDAASALLERDDSLERNKPCEREDPCERGETCTRGDPPEGGDTSDSGDPLAEGDPPLVDDPMDDPSERGDPPP